MAADVAIKLLNSCKVGDDDLRDSVGGIDPDISHLPVRDGGRSTEHGGGHGVDLLDAARWG